MTDYPYIKTTAKLKEFLQKIPSLGSPPSVSTRWLPKVGFKSANHRPIIRIMDFIGFIKSNKPTERWRLYQVKTNSRHVLAEAIAEGYSELYNVYPDAHRRSDSELREFFKSIYPPVNRLSTQRLAPLRHCVRLPNLSARGGRARLSPAKHKLLPSSCQWMPMRAQLWRRPRPNPCRSIQLFTLTYRFIFIRMPMRTKSERYSRIWDAICMTKTSINCHV